MKSTIIGAALALTVGVTSASAQANCNDRDTIVERLASKYGEHQQSLGITENKVLLEVFANLETGTFSVIVTDANKVSCLIATGTNHEATLEHAPNNDPKLQGYIALGSESKAADCNPVVVGAVPTRAFKFQGVFVKRKSKVVKHSTRELLTKALNQIEKFGYCPINQKWMLQVRGKDKRRLEKYGFYQKGRRLYIKKS